eukprot:m.71991 g.71991  ORF g.71991 m.71991 type:complete len:158 (+) comp12320_c0_seq4:1966-2439(+)
MAHLENAAPAIHAKAKARLATPEEDDDAVVDLMDAREVFDLVRSINDPEHPLSLEELSVVQEKQITVDPAKKLVCVQFTPTIPHCSMAKMIGLCIWVQLHRCLPPQFKIDVEIFPGTHNQRDEVNKQLADKERVVAALENPALRNEVEKCLTARHQH